jgi:hypothetical protein
MRPTMMRALVVTVAAASAALSACDDGTPVHRGYGSRQISQLRDTKFYFEGARGDIVLYAIGNGPVDSTLFSLDLRTGAVVQDGASYDSIPFPQYTFPSDPSARYHCSYESGADGNQEVRIDDAQTGATTTLSDVAFLSNCPTDGDSAVKVWRIDTGGYETLWTGPFDNLQMASVDLVVLHPFGSFSAGTTATTVLAWRSANPNALGIYSIDLTTFAVTELVAPVLAGGAWADGATPGGVLDSATLDQGADSPLAVGDHFLYWRLMSDGTAMLFAGPFASGPAPELALFTAGLSLAKRGFLRSTTGQSLSRSVLPTWQNSADPTAGADDIQIWDDARQRLLTCPAAIKSTAVGVLSDDHTRLLEFVLQQPVDPAIEPELPTGPVLLVDLAGPASGAAACTTIVDANVNVAGLSPDGSAMFWLVEPPAPARTSQLYVAASDGSAPRLVDDDWIEGPPNAPRFVGPSQLEVDIAADLVWADVHDDPVVSHPIAERTSGGAIDRGRWLIAGYDESIQDGTATLGIVNRDTGEKKQISPDVAAFLTPDLADQRVVPAPDRTSSDPLRIVYLVRGRNPSPQDGLWVADIYPSDTP